MARAIWNGQISFGLVTVPVSLFSAEESGERISFHLIDSRNQARVRYERVNEVTGEDVPWDQIVKGYEYKDGNYVLLSDEDFERVAIEATKTIDISDFVDRDAIDYVYFDKPYYLVPAKRAEKAYVLLRETLARTNKVGVAKVVIRSRQRLAAVMAEGKALVLCILRFEHELRSPDDLDLPKGGISSHKISKRELDMAEQLVAAMSGEWKPEQYTDEYSERLLAWIKEKADTGDMAPPPEPEESDEGAEVVDLMSLLKRSIAGERRPEDPMPHKERPAGRKGRSSGKKRAAKKPAAKRTRTKTAAKKSAPKKRAKAAKRKAPTKRAARGKATKKRARA